MRWHTQYEHLLLLRNFFCCNFKSQSVSAHIFEPFLFWKLIIFCYRLVSSLSVSIRIGCYGRKRHTNFDAILNCKYCVNKFHRFFFLFSFTTWIQTSKGFFKIQWVIKLQRSPSNSWTIIKWVGNEREKEEKKKKKKFPSNKRIKYKVCKLFFLCVCGTITVTNNFHDNKFAFIYL